MNDIDKMAEQLEQSFAWEKDHPLRSAPRRTRRYIRHHNPLKPAPWHRVRWTLQRAQRGWSDRDLWGFDTYLATLIGTALVRLRDTGHGYPGDGHYGGRTPEEWRATLTSISDALLAYEKIWQDIDHYEDYSEAAQWAMVQLAYHFPSIWD